MLSQQLLIKIDEETIARLRAISNKFGLKLSTFARIILKNYVESKTPLSRSDQNDAKLLKKTMQKKTEWHDWRDLENQLFK